MEYKYTINEIASKTKVSLQSLYTLIKKNKEFINDHSRRKQRKVFYDQEAFNFFMEYYGQESHDETPLEGPKTASEDEKKESESQEQIDALKAEIEALKTQLEEKEKERKELLQQNGALILTIQQQQQEKMLLLPAPKKTLRERIFGKKE